MEGFKKGDKLHCRSWRELKAQAFTLSSMGYGVCVIGFSDMSDNILTITEEPEERETEK